MSPISKHNDFMDEDELEKINQEIEQELLQGVVSSDEVEEDKKKNSLRFIFLLLMTLILVSVVLFNIGQIIYKSLKLLFN